MSNLDHEYIEEHGEQHHIVENYFTVEFVAIPPDFDISNFLSIREQGGMFGDLEHVNISQVRKIADGVKHSPVFSILNNALLSIDSCLYFLNVVNELGLVVKSIHNPIRSTRSDYKRFLKYYNEYGGKNVIHIRGQDVKRINIVIVNIFPLMSQKVIDEAIGIAGKLQEYQTEVDENIKNLA